MLKISWERGEVPGDGRRASVVPVFIKGKKEEPGNCRSVSLSLVLGKILEWIIKRSLCKHLENNTVITSSQYVLVKKKILLD